MYKSIFLLSIFAYFNSQKTYSQNFIESFYDQNMKEVVSSDQARFYSISRSTDSGWYTKNYLLTLNRLQMFGLFENKENTIKNGHFSWFYPDGKIKTIGKYIHDLKEGIWLSFYNDGSLKDSFNYKNGHLVGISLSWFNNGVAKDSFNINENGSSVRVSWFDNGSPSAAGRYVGFTNQNGRWKYYHKNGNISALELYDNGILKDKQYFDENGNPTDTIMHDQEARFLGGDRGWSKYISSQLYFPSNLEFKNSFITSIIIEGIVNEEGQVTNVEVTVPLHPEFDKIALKAVTKSPKWIPAISHNRRVYHNFRQTVTFLQSGY